jgi:hypothetical protein
MNILPINKIILASFAFALSHWKKIIEISIIPLVFSAPFLWTIPELFLMMDHFMSGNKVVSVQLPEYLFTYLVLFMYGYSMLSINIYKLVLLGESSVNGLIPILDAAKIIRYVGLTILVGFITIFPVMFTGLFFLQLVAYFFIVPITLNFVSISVDMPIKFSWKLPFNTHLNLFLLQAMLPSIIGFIFAVISDFIGLGGYLDWFVKIVIYYWSSVNLALCYQLINNKYN